MELDGSSIDMALNTDQKNGWNIFSKSVLCDIKEFKKNPSRSRRTARQYVTVRVKCRYLLSDDKHSYCVCTDGGCVQ